MKTYDVSFAIPGPDWCRTANARCFEAPNKTCAASISVDCGCTPGAMCQQGLTCDAPLNASVTSAQTAAKHKAQCCYALPQHCIAPWVGRALQGPIEDPVARADWSAREPPTASPMPWAKLAAMEHASIASFARASLELLALGAPPDLVADTHRAALDEIEHARFAFAMASIERGHELGPPPLAAAVAPIEPPTFASFAARTFEDACVTETIAAEVTRRRAEGDARLLAIAADEERHAELAWRTLAWAVRAGGADVAAALERALGRVWTQKNEEQALLREVVLPCARALLASI